MAFQNQLENRHPCLFETNCWGAMSKSTFLMCPRCKRVLRAPLFLAFTVINGRGFLDHRSPPEKWEVLFVASDVEEAHLKAVPIVKDSSPLIRVRVLPEVATTLRTVAELQKSTISAMARKKLHAVFATMLDDLAISQQLAARTGGLGRGKEAQA